MFETETWFNYAGNVRASIASLPRNFMKGQRRFQIVLNSHITAIAEHDYPGTFNDWEALIEGPDRNAEAV